MKILHVNDADLRGRRFNGFDLLDDLDAYGVESSMAVLTKESEHPRVTPLLDSALDVAMNDALWRMEQQHSLSGVLYPWARSLTKLQEFQEADVVHYHLIHNGVISLLDLPRLTTLKPSVWTLHDLWPLTGHCVQPIDCPGWRSGCDPCPHLERWFPLREDRSGELWRLKQEVYRELDIDIVVASDFLRECVIKSPLMSGLSRMHLVPFGVRSERFLGEEERRRSRKLLQIADDEFVVLFRAGAGPLKGTDRLVRELASRKPAPVTTLLALDGVGLLSRLAGDYRVREFGWVVDDAFYARLLSACDVFVMPSEAESFGLMALEAMAAGRPVVCLAKTAVASTTHAPGCGVAVPKDSPGALVDALAWLSADPAEARRRGELGRKVVADVYGHDRYVEELISVYASVVRQSGTGGSKP